MAPVDEDPDDRRSSVDSRQAVRGQSSKPALYDSGEESEDATQLGHEGMCVRQEHVSEDGDYDNLSREKGQAMHVKSEKGQWIVLDLMDDHGALDSTSSACKSALFLIPAPYLAYTNLLRILHRSAAHPIRSAFIPALPALTTPTPTPTPLHSPSSASYHPSRRSSIGTPQSTSPLIVPSLTIQPAFGAHPYPEWRIGVVRRALRAGLGEVGKAMSYLMWGDLYSDKLNGEKGFNPIGQTSRGRDADSTDTERESHTKDLSSDDSNSFSSRASPAPSDDPSGRCDIEYSSEEETSEAEWEGWMGDLVRQASVSEAKKKQKGGEAHFGSDYEDHRYNSRLQHWFAQREFQEERRAFEPTGVVVSDSSAVGNYSSLHASALTHTPSESYSSMTRVLDAGRSLQSTSYSQSSPKSTLTSAYGFNFSPNKDDPLSSATSPSKTNESDSPSQLLHNSASSAYRSPKRFTDGSESNCSSMRRAASSSNLVSIASTEPVSVNSSSGMGRFLGAVTGPSRNASGAIDRAGGSILPATAKLKKKDKRSGKGKDRRGSEARGAERDGDSSIEEQEKLSEGWNKQQRSKLSLAFSSPDGSSQHTQTQPRSSVLRHVGSQSSISEKG
jgi:hypothetical protein